ncbi:ABC transporter ATP-binding protein [Carboxydothermus islandicus]|uniref:ABC transporter ATP-binding protein n=1 Tax=Carboxydothermus islandicus TaxID=661089 RepID=A0A1L8D1K7_9THEO|nr:ABC transporter ATP-binding protein [Carboxydothermus islandicus]GAV25075.1 ABC transporter ATP-binding protein [Carboxydothermus islandicus]
MEKVLELKGITKRFPGLVANDNISFDALRGEVHALVGENGAGKSTLMKIITGLYQPDEGEMFLKGEKVKINGPRDAIAKGIGMVHQHFMLINRFNVVQNIILGYENSPGGVIDFDKAKKKVEELCELYDFKLDLNAQVGDLSVGHQQRVEILKVLYRGAEILILDEPTAVLTPQEVKELFVNLRKLKQEGKTILFISHKLDEVLEISDRITVLRRGKVIGTVKASETSKKQLAEMMVGRPVLFRLEKPIVKTGDVILEVRNLKVKGSIDRHQLNNLSLSIRAGEIYGIAGVEGNGQRELVEAIMGLLPYDGGEILIKGKSNKGLDTRAIRETGVGYIPEDRHQRGLVLPMTVWENMVLGLERKPEYSRWWKLFRDKIKSLTSKKVEEFDIRLGSIELAIRNLSGGNQQKVILARELSYEPDLIIAAQPVRGLDIGAIEFVHKKLIEARNNGKAVLLISADLEEVLSLSDRVGIMYNGEIVKEFVPGELELEEIGQYMLGAHKEVGVG